MLGVRLQCWLGHKNYENTIRRRLILEVLGARPNKQIGCVYTMLDSLILRGM